MRIEYIGPKAIKTDNIAGTGIDWHGAGDVHEVPDDKAAKLLAWPLIWREAGTAPKANSIQDGNVWTIPRAPEPECPYGSSTLASHIDIGGIDFTLGDIVAGAHAASTLSVADWNALDEGARDVLLNAHIDAMRKAAGPADAPAPAAPKAEPVKPKAKPGPKPKAKTK